MLCYSVSAQPLVRRTHMEYTHLASRHPSMYFGLIRTKHEVCVALCALAALSHGFKVELIDEKSFTFYPRPLPGPAVKISCEKQCSGTPCPTGCSPEVMWYCCPDNLYCAATAADCPFAAAKAQLVKIAARKQCEGTNCPQGFCPEQNWYWLLPRLAAVPLLLTTTSSLSKRSL